MRHHHQTCRHVLDEADAEVLVPHGVQPQRCPTQPPPQHLVPRIQHKLHAVLQAQVLCQLLEVVHPLLILGPSAAPHQHQAHPTPSTTTPVFFDEVGHSPKLQGVVLLRSELPHRQDHLLPAPTRPMQGQLLQVLSATGGEDHVDLTATAPAPQPPQPVDMCPGPVGVDHDQVCKGAHHTIQTCKRHVVPDFEAGQDAAAGDEGPVVHHPGSTCGHRPQHVRGYGGVVQVGSGRAPGDGGEGQCGGQARGVHPHMGHQAHQGLTTHHHAAHCLTQESQHRVPLRLQQASCPQVHKCDGHTLIEFNAKPLLCLIEDILWR
mmetsp:Transcript_10629/g.15813  ORF Transcript_10629/g.15813 Transcript_10629/m.15813 type:complete len:319 (-) Transcript_10629:285-1241(-)